MGQYQPHEVIKLCLFDDLDCNLTTGVCPAYNAICSSRLNGKARTFVLARHFLSVDIIKSIAFVDGWDHLTWLVKLILGSGH